MKNFLKLIEEADVKIIATDIGEIKNSDKNKFKKAGIYAIINLENDKYYIGSTVDFLKRFQHHVSSLQRHKHHNIYLQNSWNKYGAEKYMFVILEELTQNIDEGYTDFLKRLREREQEFLNIFSPYDDIGYNISYSTEGCKKFLTERDLIDGNSVLSKEQFDKIVELLLDPYNSIVSIANAVNSNRGTVGDIYAKHTYTELTKDIVFPKRKEHTFKNDYLGEIEELIQQGMPYKEICKKINISMPFLKQLAEQNGIGRGCKVASVYQYDCLGNFIKKYETTEEAAKENNTHPGEIRKCCQHKRRISKEYVWSYDFPLQQKLTLIEKALGTFLNATGKPVVLYDSTQTPLKIFSSVSVLASFLKLHEYTLNTKLRKNDEGVIIDNYFIKYAKDASEEDLHILIEKRNKN